MTNYSIDSAGDVKKGGTYDTNVSCTIKVITCLQFPSRYRKKNKPGALMIPLWFPGYAELAHHRVKVVRDPVTR